MRKLSWKVRSLAWNWFLVLKMRAGNARRIPRPTNSGSRLRRIPLSELHPSIPIADIFVADHIPADEKSWPGLALTRFQARCYRYFPPKVPGLASISADPIAAIDLAYGTAARKLLAAPAIPTEYQEPVDLGSLAVAGPYSCYLQRRGDGAGYEWDLTILNRYEHHPGLRRLGVRVLFETDEATRRLKATEIDCELGQCTPADPTWELAQKIALCAATTHLSLARHSTGIHLALVEQVAIATRNVLPAHHCVRRLLWAHVWGTQYSNELVADILMAKGGDFEEIFSFTHSGLCSLISDAYREYDIRVIDPGIDADRRGIRNGGFDLPTLDNRLAHWNVMYSHARRYLELYYDSDQDLRDDAAVGEWVDELNRLVPNGVDRLLDGKLTIEGAARLIASYIYIGTVEHEVLGSGMWNYQVWTHVQPIRVYKNGRREPIDLYQRLVNYNFILNVRRAPLLQDLSYLAGNDDKAAQAFSTFLAELAALQVRLKGEPHEYWKAYPADLEVSVNT